MLSLQQRERRQAWVLLAPMLVAMFLLTAWPLARTLWLSFTDTALVGNGEATNYVWLEKLSLCPGPTRIFAPLSPVRSTLPWFPSPLRALSACWSRCCSISALSDAISCGCW
ncbi:Uncharacterised protein [Raoultella terrigena]|uniref:Uncharacterized protein n=1 Tax=Raoultella terrigena TaxID=577 RepID=A0A3P8M2V1_RAOTE|nr:Uncharacterised protein [Raoultella terrigena]